MNGCFIIISNVVVIVYDVVIEDMVVVVDFGEYFFNLEVGVFCLYFVYVVRFVVFVFGVFYWSVFGKIKLVGGDGLNFFYWCGDDDFDGVMLVIDGGDIFCYGF